MLKPLGTYETRGSASLQLQGGAGGGNSWRSPAGAPAAVEPGEGGEGQGGEGGGGRRTAEGGRRGEQ